MHIRYCAWIYQLEFVFSFPSRMWKFINCPDIMRVYVLSLHVNKSITFISNSFANHSTLYQTRLMWAHTAEIFQDSMICNVLYLHIFRIFITPTSESKSDALVSHILNASIFFEMLNPIFHTTRYIYSPFQFALDTELDLELFVFAYASVSLYHAYN